MMPVDPEEVLILDWSKLTSEQIFERISWLRETLTAGTDWGYCEEAMTCVIMNSGSAMMYRLRWFESGNQSLIDKPAMLKGARDAIQNMFGDQ